MERPSGRIQSEPEGAQIEVRLELVVQAQAGLGDPLLDIFGLGLLTRGKLKEKSKRHFSMDLLAG